MIKVALGGSLALFILYKSGLLPIIVFALITLSAYELYTRKTLKGIPTPFTDYPLVRSLPALINGMQDFQEKHWVPLVNKYLNKPYASYVPLRPMAAHSHNPEVLKWVMKDNFNNYIKGEELCAVLHGLVGNGIFAADSETWKSQRQIASNLFSVKEMREMIPVFIDHANILSKILKEASEKGVGVDMQETFARYTLDSIIKVAFGEDLHSLEHPVEFGRVFDAAVVNVSSRVFRLDWKFPILRDISPEEQILKNSVKKMDEWIYEVIAKRKADPNLSQRTDLLSRYLQLKDDNGNALSDVYIRDVLASFLLAGRDTVSQLLSWTVYELSSHPDVVAKLREEIKGVLEDNNGQLDYDSLKQFKYMKYVFDETLRLWPPVLVEQKQAVKDDVWPDGTSIPAGSSIIWSMYAIGRREDIWKDARAFKPERWTEADVAMSGAYHPFLMGPRVCLGKEMALIEAKIVMITLLQKFDIKILPGTQPVVEFSVTLKARDGMPAVIRPISN